MQSRIVNQQENTSKIDWDKKQLLRSKTGNVVLTNGEHTEKGFTGTVLCSKSGIWEIGTTYTSFRKEGFTLITEPITIEFTP